VKRSISAAVIGSILVLALASSASAQLGGGKGSPGRASAAPHLGASPPPPPPPSMTCVVGTIELSGREFNCGSQSFRVFSTTSFQLGSAGSGFSSLQSGMNVQVRYHGATDEAVADSVTSTP
jgi:hypothetical protein